MKSNNIYVADNKLFGTHSKAVFHESNRTVYDEIEDLKQNVTEMPQTSTSGRGYPIFCLRERIYVRPVPTSVGVGHEFVTTGLVNFYRNTNGTMGYITLPKNITLGVGQAYVFDYSKGSFELRGTSGTNEYTACSSTEVILYSNYGGVAQGVLKDWFVECFDYDIPITECVGQVTSLRTTQGVFIVGDDIYTTTHSNDEHTDFVPMYKNSITTGSSTKTFTHNLGHLNSCDYSASRDMLLTANSSKSYTLVPEMFIFKNWSSVLDSNTQLDFNALDKTVIQFTEFSGEYKWNFAWGYDVENVVWASCCDMRILRKITLGVDGNGDFDGTYTIDKTWYSEQSDIIGGLIFKNGTLYAGVKGSYGIRKMIPTGGNAFKSEYVRPVGKLGDMQGIAVYNSDMYCVSDTNCTIIPFSI